MTQAQLQLRWEASDTAPDEFGCRDWICKYELSIPLDEHDIRREDESYKKVRDCIVVELDSTKRGSAQAPCVNQEGNHYFDAPYRDGAHAKWDALKLGGLPIVCIATDGTVIPKPDDPATHTPKDNVTSWQDISTAAKDRSKMLLWHESWLHPVIGYWSRAMNSWLEYGSRDIKADAATHWMPLPAAPVANTEGSDRG